MNIKMYEEAIEQFKVSKDFAFIDENPRMERFYELAIKAIEKQIPMKVKHPIDRNEQYNRLVVYCYSCGTTVKDMKYCYYCGQRLDWGI